MNYTGLIFDLDGTLYDAKHFGKRLVIGNIRLYENLTALRNVLKPLPGKAFASGSAYKMFLFEGMAHDLNTRFPDRPPVNAATMGHWYHHEYYPAVLGLLQKRYESEAVTQDLLRSVSRRIPVSLCSDIGVIDERLRAVGLTPATFAYRLSTDETGIVRPAAKTYTRLAGLMGTRPEKTLVIGDSDEVDGESARSAGMDFFRIVPDDFKGSWNRLKNLLSP